MKAAIYLRVSTDEQAKNGFSLDDQERQCRSRAAELGADEVAVFREEGVTGGLLERPSLTALRDAVRDGVFAFVIVKDPDRLSRSLRDQLLVADELDRRAKLEFVNFERDGSPESQMFFQLRGMFSEYEKAKITERMSSGRRQKARSGKMPMGLSIYGYDYDMANGALVVNEAEALVVQRIFTLMASDGIGPNGIAKRLNSEGVPTKRRAKVWSKTVVGQILRNPTYSGTFYYSRNSHKDVYLNRYKRDGDKARSTPNPFEEWIPVPVPAIIDMATWHQVQDYMENARRLWRGHSKTQYLLTGLVTCGRCGQTMPGYSNKDRTRQYTCVKNYAGAKHPGCKHRANADQVEEAVLLTLRQALNSNLPLPETFKGRDSELAEVDALLREQTNARQRLVGALEKGLLDEADITANLGRIAVRIRELSRRREEIRSESDRQEAWTVLRDRAKEYLRDDTDLLDLTFEEQKQFIRMLVRKIVVYPSGEITVETRLFGDLGQDKKVESHSSCFILRTKTPARRAAN
jgi:site-specific DNA recombinase